jgi:hypothetical protein
MRTDDGTFGVTMTVVAPSAEHATQRAFEALDKAAEAAGIEMREAQRFTAEREPARV